MRFQLIGLRNCFSKLATATSNASATSRSKVRMTGSERSEPRDDGFGERAEDAFAGKSDEAFIATCGGEAGNGVCVAAGFPSDLAAAASVVADGAAIVA